MTYNPLEPPQTVILFADLQTGIIERAGTNDPNSLRRAVSALAKLSKVFAIPTIVTAAPSQGAPQLIPELSLALGELTLHVRNTTDAFTHPDTRNAIADTRRKTLLISGVATEIIVQHTALSGIAHDFDVQVVVDACGGLSSRTEDAAFRRLAQAGVILTSIASIAGQLASDFTQPLGSEALGILYDMSSR